MERTVEVITLTRPELERLIQQTVRVTVTEFTSNRIPPLMDKAQVAEYLGKTTATINRYMREGMPFRKIDGGYPEFYKFDIDRWLRERSKEIQGQTDNTEG